MFKCKSGKHTWLAQHDAEKCCNGYERTLVFSGGDNRQVCDGQVIGRAWRAVEPEPHPHRSGERER